ncbi:MAG: hypothetical protein WD355_08365 [Balneolaceae bacterium]
MTAWAYILASSLCSILVAHLLKRSEVKGFHIFRVLTVNYTVAATLAFLLFNAPVPVVMAGWPLSLPVLILLTGTLFFLNYLVFSKSVYYNGLGVSVASMRLSLILPVLLSVIWYQEFLNPLQWTGIFLVFCVLWLLLPEKPDRPKTLHHHYPGLLLLLFLMTGVGDASLKIYESDFSSLLSLWPFLGSVFFVSACVGTLYLAIRREWSITSGELVAGISIGIPNLFSVYFLVEALALLQGGVVYSLVNLFTVFGAAVLGLFYWSDRLSTLQWCGLVLSVVAICLIL